MVFEHELVLKHAFQQRLVCQQAHELGMVLVFQQYKAHAFQQQLGMELEQLLLLGMDDQRERRMADQLEP